MNIYLIQALLLQLKEHFEIKENMLLNILDCIFAAEIKFFKIKDGEPWDEI